MRPRLPVERQWLQRFLVFFAVGCIPYAGQVVTTAGAVWMCHVWYGRPYLCQKEKSDAGEDETQLEEGTKTTNVETKKERIHFVDNLKVFLAFLVVTFHLISGMGGSGPGAWYLSFGNFAFGYRPLLRSFDRLCQYFFMPCFMFCSAYMVPSSFARKGKTQFLRDRAFRLWIPVLVVTFVLVPMCFAIGQILMQRRDSYILIFPFPGHAWFILWLLLLNYVYASVREAGELASARGDTTTSYRLIPFCDMGPLDISILGSHRNRWLAGIGICSMLQMAVCFARNRNLYFAGMPLTAGSLPCDLLAFWLGLVAGQEEWFAQGRRIRDVVNIWWVRLSVVVQVYVLEVMEQDSYWKLGLFFAAVGLYCVDMNLAILEFFQTNFHRPWPRWMIDAAYPVYVIHGNVVVCLQWAFVTWYNGRPATTMPLVFPYFPAASVTPMDETIILKGTALLFVATHVIVWPLGYGLKRAFPRIF